MNEWTIGLRELIYLWSILVLLSHMQLVSLVNAGGGNCLQSLDVYFIMIGNQFIPGMEVANLTSIQSFTGPSCFACGNPPIIEVPAMTNRIFVNFVYEETGCLDPGSTPYGPILVDDLTGNIIRSNVSYELPYKIPTSYGIDATSSNEYVFVTTFSTSLETLTIQWYGNGWNVNGEYWSTDYHLTAIAGQATPFYIRPQTINYPLNQPITYDLSIPSGAGRIDQMQITFTPDPTLTFWMYLTFSAFWTAPQAQTILLIATRNYTVSPLNQADDERFGSSFTIPVQIVPNAVCGQGLESGHFVFGPTAGSTSIIPWQVPTLKSWTSCHWMKPEFASGQTQIWFDLGSFGHELQAGIFGNDAAANGGPMGSFFMRDLVTGDVNIATVVGYTPGSNATWNMHVWYHVCWVYYAGDGGVNNDGGNNHEKLMHIFVNGIPASAPTLLSTAWTDPTPLYPGATQITFGGRPDGSLPASGGFDEFVFYSTALPPLQIYYGYQTQLWQDYTGSHAPVTWYFDQPAILGILGLGSGLYDPPISFTNGDTICTALSQQMGSVSRLTGSNCVQPFRYDALKSANGTQSKNDGQLQVAIDGSVTTGGGTWIGEINTNLTAQAILSCVWVNRYNTPPDTQQTIFSIGSFNHSGLGLITVSYFNDNIQVTFGGERSMDNYTIPLSWDNEYGSFSNLDSKLWIHWCFHTSPGNTDYYFPDPYWQLYRNGRWWYRSTLKGGLFQTGVVPTVQPNDNVICIGCTVSPVNVFPFQGGLDEFWTMVQPTIWWLNDAYMFQAFATDSWFISAIGNGLNPPIVWLRFNESVGSTLTSTVFTNPLNETGLVTMTFKIYTGSSVNSWTAGDATSVIGFTCLVLAPAVPANTTIVQQFGLSYPIALGGSSTPIEFVKIRPELNQTLILQSHAFPIADHDFSICYWVKRTTMIASSSLTYYDVSIGTSPALWIGEYVTSSTEYFSFSFGTNTPLQVPSANVRGSLDQQHWLYICGSYASISQNGVQGATRKLYRNGQLLGQDFPSADFHSSAPIRIGARADDVLGADGPHFYDEIAIFTSVITTQQILDYFNSQSYGISPVIQLNFQASSMIGNSFQSIIGGDIFQCMGTQPCGYHSFDPTDSEAVNSPTVQLLVPQVCPGDYYADGALAITTRDYSPASGLQDLHTGSGPLLYTDSLNSAFVGTDFSFSIWFRLESNQPDSSNTTIFEVGCPGSIYQLFASPSNQRLALNANGLIGLHTTTMTPNIGVWVLVMGVYYVATDSIDLYRFDGTTLQSTPTDSSGNIHYLNCPTGINAILGGFSNYSNFNGMLDEFRVWNLAITSDLNNLEYLSIGRVDYLNPYSAPTLKDRLNLQKGLQIYLPFSEQRGTTAYSYHTQPTTLIANLTAFSATSQNSSVRELQWYAPGITNYYDNLDYGLVGNGNSVTPDTEYSIRCAPALLPSPIFIQSAQLSRTGVQYMTEFASVDFIFLQTIGPQGFTVVIDAPAGVTVTPNTFIYASGSASRQASAKPMTFNLTFTKAQYVTLWFRFIGPEALHLKRYQITPPSFDFPIYADLWKIDLSCSMMTQVSATAYSFSPTSPVFTNKTDIFNHGDKTIQPLFTSIETQLNWCEFTMARFNSSMMGSVTMTAPDGTIMTSPTAFSVWQVGFYVPLGDSYPTITSPKDGAYSSHFFRGRSSVQHSVTVATPTEFLHGVPSSINVTIPATIHFNVTILPFLTENGSVVPPSLVFLPPSDAHSFTFTMDVTHPAITYVTIILPLTGYGANDDLFPITPVTLLNRYQLSNAFLLSASFSSVNLTMIDVPLFGAVTPVSGAFDVPLLNYQVGSDVLVTLQFDQWLSGVNYQLVTNSSVTMLPINFATVATHLDTSIGLPRPLTIAFNLTNLSLGDNMLFIQTISSDGSVNQSWVFNLTRVVPSTITLPIVNGTAPNVTATNTTVSNPDNQWTEPIPDSPLQVDGSCFGAQNLCLYGSECVVNRTSSRSPPSCICLPFFRGPLCQFAILDCIGCVIPAPSRNISSPPIYANLTLVGLGFDRIYSVTVGSLLIQPYDFSQFAPIMGNNSLLQSVFTRHEFDSSITGMSQGFFVLRLQIDVNRVGINISALTTTQAPPKVKNTYSHNTQLLVTTPTGDHYIPVTFELIFSDTETTKFPYLIYQSWYSTCLQVGEWKPDPINPSMCLPCPEGGECPGGGVDYPLPGWWSPNEFTAPVHCELDDESCPGVALPPLSYDPSGHVDTQLCSVGYNGTVCGSCAGNYYQSGLRCFPCTSHASESAQLAGLFLFGVCILAFLSIIVAVAKSEVLATMVALFVLLQQIIATGKASSQTWPKGLQPLSDLFLTISIINFDITFLRSGCVTPTYSFIGTFYGTLLLVLIAFLMFYIACQCRKHWLLMRLSKLYAAQNAAIRRKVKDKKEDELFGTVEVHNESDAEEELTVEEKAEFHAQRVKQHQQAMKQIRLGYERRLIHARFILCSLFYLKLTTLELNGLNCHQVPRSTTLVASTDPTSLPTDLIYVLRSDSSLECWQGGHLVTAIIIIILLVGFSFGFPIICVRMLTRAFAPILLRDPRHSKSLIGRLLQFLGYQQPTKSTASLDRPSSVQRVGSLMTPTNGNATHEEVDQAEKVAKQQRDLHTIHMELFGYLFRNLKDERYFFRLLSFPVSLGFTFTLVFVTDVQLRTFILGFLYAFNTLLHCNLIPFIKWRSNFISSGIQLFSLIYTIGVLALMKGSDVNEYTMWLGFVALFLAVQYVIVVVGSYDNKKQTNSDEQLGEEHMHPEETHNLRTEGNSSKILNRHTGSDKQHHQPQSDNENLFVSSKRETKGHPGNESKPTSNTTIIDDTISPMPQPSPQSNDGQIEMLEMDSSAVELPGTVTSSAIRPLISPSHGTHPTSSSSSPRPSPSSSSNSRPHANIFTVGLKPIQASTSTELQPIVSSDATNIVVIHRTVDEVE